MVDYNMQFETKITSYLGGKIGTNIVSCLIKRGCVWVGLSRWTEGYHRWNKVITETRVSKFGGPNQETLHFQIAHIQGYHINLTLLFELPDGRK